MKTVKFIFIVLEAIMLVGIVAITFLTDWSYEVEVGTAWMFQLMIVLMALLAVVFQSEQQNIDWVDYNV